VIGLHCGWLLDETWWQTENIFAANDSFYQQAMGW
jgi:hypothetical protein